MIAFCYLETFILKDALDGSILAGWRQLCLEDHTKGPIANNLALSILEISSFTSDSILNALTDNFYRDIRICFTVCACTLWECGGWTTNCLPPIRKLLNAPGRCDDMLQVSMPIGNSSAIGWRRETAVVVDQGI